MANAGNTKVLKARVEIDTKSAEKKLKNLTDKINNLNKAFSKIANNNDKLERSIKQSNSQAEKLERNFGKANRIIGKLPTSMQKFVTSIMNGNRAAKQTETIFDRIHKKILGIAATYAGIMGGKAIINLSDTMTSAQNRLNDYNSLQLGDSGITTGADGSTAFSNKTTQTTSQQMDKMFAASQRARVGYDELMKNVSKSMVLAGDAFQDNIDNAIYFQEIMGKAYTLGGASAAEMSSSMYQMIQALGSGTLAGDELRSVREGAPLAYQAIEKYAQGIYNSEESLKDMASQGLITSDIVVAAMLTAADQIDSRFNNTSMTFAQAFLMMKNTAIQSFRPILEYMNQFLNSETGQKALGIINEIIVATSYAVAIIIRAITAIITFVVDNWEWLRPILISIAVFIAGLILYKIGGAILTLLAQTVVWIATNPVLAMVVLLVGLIIGLIVQIAQTSKNVHDFLCQLVWSIMAIVLGVLVVIAVASLVTGAIVVSIPMLILLVVIAVVAAITYLWLKYTDVFVGCWYVTKAVAYNVVMFLGNLLNALYESICAIATNIEIAFCNAWYGAKAGFWNFISSVLDGLVWLEKPLNALLEALDMDTVDFSGLAATAKSKAESNESNIREYVDVSDAWNNGFNSYDYKNFGDEYDEGFQKGTDIQNKLQDMDMKDLMVGITGMDGLTDINKGLADANAPEYALETSDPSSLLGDLPTGALEDTADNTEKIADSMDILDTELKYLKELGEREAINKFTTAEIRVEMKNDNYISERVDMDGVVEYLSDKLYEELGVVANGVHY